MTQLSLSMEQKQNLRRRQQTAGGQGRGCWGRNGREVVVSRCKLSYIEQTNNKVLLYSTGNYIQYPMINHNGKEYEKGYIYV